MSKSDSGITEFHRARIYAFCGYPKIMIIQDSELVWYASKLELGEYEEGSYGDVDEWVKEEMDRLNKVVAEMPTEYCT